MTELQLLLGAYVVITTACVIEMRRFTRWNDDDDALNFTRGNHRAIVAHCVAQVSPLFSVPATRDTYAGPNHKRGYAIL